MSATGRVTDLAGPAVSGVLPVAKIPAGSSGIARNPPYSRPYELYVNPVNGDDTAGGHSVGEAFLTLRKAIDTANQSGHRTHIRILNYATNINVGDGPIVSVQGHKITCEIPYGCSITRTFGTGASHKGNDAKTTVGGTSVASPAQLAFASGDVGRVVSIYGAGVGGGTFYGFIASVGTSGGDTTATFRSGTTSVQRDATTDRKVKCTVTDVSSAVANLADVTVTNVSSRAVISDTTGTFQFTTAHTGLEVVVDGIGQAGQALRGVIVSVAGGAATLNVFATNTFPTGGTIASVGIIFGDLFVFHGATGGLEGLVVQDQSGTGTRLGAAVKIVTPDQGFRVQSSNGLQIFRDNEFTGTSALGDWEHIVDADGSWNQNQGGPGVRRVTWHANKFFGCRTPGEQIRLNGVVHWNFVGIGSVGTAPTSIAQGILILDPQTSAAGAFGAVTNSVGDVNFVGFEGTGMYLYVEGQDVSYVGGSVRPSFPPGDGRYGIELSKWSDHCFVATNFRPTPTTGNDSTTGDFGTNNRIIHQGSLLQLDHLAPMVTDTRFAGGAKGDGVLVTDAVMTSGSNQIDSATANFKVGQVVIVAGAGANIATGGTGAGPTVPGVLKGYVKTIALNGTRATLVTTATGSTAANASASVSGVSAVYGTDDTAAFQAAVDSLSTAALAAGVRAELIVPAGATYLLGQMTPRSNVTLRQYGATFYSTYGTANGWFKTTSAVSVDKFRIFGGTYKGFGLEGAWCVFQSFNPAVGSDVEVSDITVENWCSGPLYFGGVTRAKASRNVFRSCGMVAGTNCINFVDQTNGGSMECIATDNIFENVQAWAIAYVNTGNASSGNRFVTITDNIIQSAAGVNSGIDIECSTSGIGDNSKFIVANNHVVNNSSTQSFAGININGSADKSPTMVHRVVVEGNTVDSPTARGIFINASSATVQGNVVKAGEIPLYLTRTQGSYAVTGDLTSGLAVINNVAGGTGVLNGTPLTGTGIPLGAYLKSGAGTTTWTMSVPATAPGTTVAITARSQSRFIVAQGNVLRQPANPLGNAIEVQDVRDFTIADNIIVTDDGSTGGINRHGINVGHCGWFTIKDNLIERPAAHGILIQNSNDPDVRGNRILNPGEAGASRGIYIQNLTGTILRVTGNIVVDDRAAHTMTYAIDVATGNTNVAGGAVVSNNQLHGYVTAPVNGTLASVSASNVTDTGVYPLSTVTADRERVIRLGTLAAFRETVDSTIPRGNVSAAASGTMIGAGVPVLQGESYGHIMFEGATVPTWGTNNDGLWYVAVYDDAGNLVTQTASQLPAAWPGANSSKQLALGSTIVAAADKGYSAVVMVYVGTGGSPSTTYTVSGSSGSIIGGTPVTGMLRRCFNSNAGQTTGVAPASLTGIVNNGSSIPYFALYT